jgi:hypothetical protein
LTIHFVLPEGYRGGLLIRTDRNDGVELKAANGVFTCPIPAEGILSIKGKGPFFEWHRVQASYANGDSIPIGRPNDSLPDDVVAYWSGGSSSEGVIDYFVGTRAESLKHFKESAAADPKVGGVRK